MALKVSRCLVVLGVAAAAASLFTLGCASNSSQGHSAVTLASVPTTAPAKTRTEKGGAELWAETCSRCHNIRSPSSYSKAQWDVAVHDMRVRANLTGQDERKILEFIKSAN